MFIFIEHLWQDLRHAARMFAKNPGFTAIAVISIAFGTGANVAIFSAADALLLRPLPVPHPSDLYTVGTRLSMGISTANVASYPDYLDIRDRTESFDGLLAFTTQTAGFVMHPRAMPQVRMATLVSGDFFRVLGIGLALGRDFRPDEDLVEGRDAVTVLSYGMWKAEFGSDPSIVGQIVRIAGTDFTVIGVAPEHFTGIDSRLIREAAFVPLAMWPRFVNPSTPNPLRQRDFRNLTLKGRLKPGVTLAEARAELTTIGRSLEAAYPDTNKDRALTAQSEVAMRYERHPIDSSVVLLLSILSIAVLCVSCANVAGLLSSRAPVRAREISLRMAIGAGRARIVRQLVTESLGIAVVGGLGGLAVGYAGILLLRQYQFPTDVVAVPVMELDTRALTFSLILAVVSAFLFGLAPALQTTRVDLVNSLKTSDTTGGRRQRLTGRHALVVVQVALSLVLLTVAAFAFQIFEREVTEGPGFRTTHMAKLRVAPSQARYDNPRASRFFEQAVEQARRVPGVRSAGVTSSMPFEGPVEYPLVLPDDYQPLGGQTGVHTWLSVVDEGYFDTMGISMHVGRGFQATDDPDTPRVAIVNDTFARHYWPEKDAVGRRIRLVDESDASVEVIGVVASTKFFYPGETLQDMVFLPMRQAPRGTMILLAETEVDSAAVLLPLRQMLQRLDGDVPVNDLQTIEAFYGNRFASVSTLVLQMIGGIGLIGLTLTMIGLYGLVSYAVSRRTREIGIRIAIGASYGRVLRMILRQGMTPALVGLAIGLVLSSLTGRLLPTLVPVADRYDAGTFYLVVPLLLLVTLVAAFVPARRAARVEPTVALRCD